MSVLQPYAVLSRVLNLASYTYCCGSGGLSREREGAGGGRLRPRTAVYKVSKLPFYVRWMHCILHASAPGSRQVIIKFRAEIICGGSHCMSGRCTPYTAGQSRNSASLSQMCPSVVHVLLHAITSRIISVYRRSITLFKLAAMRRDSP